MTSKETDAMWRTRSEQPEALRLADALERSVKRIDDEDDVIDLARWFVEDAETELRRLHAVNTELLEALDWIASRCPEQLLAWPLHAIHQESAHDAGACARAAIAKATGEQA